VYGKSNLYSIDIRARLFVEMAENHKAINLLQNFEINQIVNEIQTSKPVLVFGSYAKGYQKKDSDLDMLIFEKVPRISQKYIKKVHILTITESNFTKGIKQNQAFETEVLRNHVLIQGTEWIVKLWLNKYGQTQMA